MNSVRDGADGDFCLGPSREERLKDLPAYFSMKLADTTDLAATAKRKVGHVERLRDICSVLSSQGEQFLHRELPVRPSRSASRYFQQRSGRKSIESCWDCRMGRKHISCPGNGQGDLKGNMMIRHIVPGTFQHSKGRVTFVQMANLRMQDLALAVSATRRSRERSPVSAAFLRRRRTIRS